MRLSYNIASPAERLADGVVQSVNVVLAVVRCVALGVLVDTSGNDVCRTRCRQSGPPVFQARRPPVIIWRATPLPLPAGPPRSPAENFLAWSLFLKA